jgi:cytochrome c nitrite reductase small subunit
MADYDVHRTDRKCWDCHREVPHGRTKSLSTSSMLGKRTEATDARMPAWLSNQLDEKEKNKATK